MAHKVKLIVFFLNNCNAVMTVMVSVLGTDSHIIGIIPCGKTVKHLEKETCKFSSIILITLAHQSSF